MIGADEYGMNDIISGSITQPLFEKFSVGNACSAQLDLVIIQMGDIPRMAEVIPWVRPSADDEWKKLGVFYVDTRSLTGEALSITAYDAMLRAEQVWVPEQDLNFPMPMTDAVDLFCKLMGVELDSRTDLNADYTIDYPANDYTIRDVLRYIAAANGGNWIITDAGELRLVPLFDSSSRNYDLLQNVSSFEAYSAIGPVSGITLLADDENYYEAGDDSEYSLEVQCPYGSQKMANDLLSKLNDNVYHGYRVQDAELPIEAELGDGVTVNGLESMLAYRCIAFGPGHLSEIAAPGESELEHEYSYESQQQREIDRKLAATRSLITKTAEQISLKVEGLEENYMELKVTLDGVTVTDETGTTMIDGGSVTTKNLYVDAANITGTLKANQVEIDLSGAISFKDLSDAEEKQTEIDAANNTASAALNTANGAANTAALASSQVANWSYSGSTYIDGSKIMTGTVMASKLLGGTVGLLAYDQTVVGSLDIAYTSTGYGLGINTSYGGIQMASAGNIFLSAGSGGAMTIGSGVIGISGGAALCLSPANYGTSLPSSGSYGQFFILVSA